MREYWIKMLHVILLDEQSVERAANNFVYQSNLLLNGRKADE